MDQIFNVLLLSGFFGSVGLFFTLGVACACKFLGWAPVNITVTINNPPGAISTVAPKPRPGEQA